MIRKKLVLAALVVVFSAAFMVPVLSALRDGRTGISIEASYALSTGSNFFGKVEDTTPAPVPDDVAATLVTKQYALVATVGDLSLYVRERFFQIAVYDAAADYLWYSVYPEYLSLGYSGASRFFIESGVVIEYYNMDNIQQEDSKSYLSGSKYNVGITYDYETVADGVLAHLDFADLAIKFDVVVRLDEGRLVVSMPRDSIVEEQIEEPFLNLDGSTGIRIVENKLKAVYLFPYFGANNYQINGYAFVPDGSGALLRYTDQRSATAYVERIYGVDEGIGQSETTAASWYLNEELTATLPVYGINHGYRQAAFLAVVTAGSGTTEIHSYPYGYMTYTINTTFFKFIVRERYTIQTSSNASDSFQLINKDPYPSDFTVEYRFLAGEDASYAGMAKSYRDFLGIVPDGAAGRAATLIQAIGLDYKRGLFGKDYVAATTYADLDRIVTELGDAGVDLDVAYLGWNAGGFYDNVGATPRASTLLGGTVAWKDLVAGLAASGTGLYAYADPLVAFSAALGDGVVKKITLTNFATDAMVTSLFPGVWFRSPAAVAESILDVAARYERLGVGAFALDTVGEELFSYREDGVDRYREQTLAILTAELAELDAYDLALYRPNGYLWNLIDAYLLAPIESNKYAYVTDSVPFVSLVLHGAADLYSPYVNYVSDDAVFALRLIEYGIMPSFLITAEPTHRLRYTNSAYVYTSHYDLWKDTIAAMHAEVGGVLGTVAGETMTYHRYVADGVAETTYGNGVRIYVNYGETDFNAGGTTVPAGSARAVRP
ncbi:MAG: DUF5696 domain-containing protein [Candidatus Izemoplasmatales bacterium]